MSEAAELAQLCQQLRDHAQVEQLWRRYRPLAATDEAVRQTLLNLAASYGRPDWEYQLLSGTEAPLEPQQRQSELLALYLADGLSHNHIRYFDLALGLGLWQDELFSQMWQAAIDQGVYNKNLQLINQYMKPSPELLSVQSCSGKKVHVINTGGMGDFLLFSRFVVLLLERGAKLSFGVRPPLLRLCQQQWPHWGQWMPHNQYPNEVDYISFDNFLPATLPQLSVHNIPPSPLISCPQHSTSAWRQQLDPAQLNIGLVWQGRAYLGTTAVSLQRRNLPTQELEQLTVPGCCFYNLQYPEEDIPPHVKKFTTPITDYADLAAAMSVLDLIISVDTGTVHLAAMLQVPVWLLCRYDSDWRWGYSASSSPWYPAMKIMRQQQPWHWSPLLQEVKQHLAVLVAQKNNGISH